MVIGLVLFAALAQLPSHEGERRAAAPRSPRVFLELSAGWGTGFGAIQMDSIDLGVHSVRGQLGAGRKGQVELGFRLTPRVALVVGAGVSTQRARFRYATDEEGGVPPYGPSGVRKFSHEHYDRDRTLAVDLPRATIGVRLSSGDRRSNREFYAGAGVGFFDPRRVEQRVEYRGYSRNIEFWPNGPHEVYFREFQGVEVARLVAQPGLGAYGRAGLVARLTTTLGLQLEVRYSHYVARLVRTEVDRFEHRLDPVYGARELIFITDRVEYFEALPPPRSGAAEVVERGGDLRSFDDGRVAYRNEFIRHEDNYEERREQSWTRAVGRPVVGASSVDMTAGLLFNF